MMQAHGIEPLPAQPALAQPVIEPPPASAAPAFAPLGQQDPLERIAMIYEDAARSSAAYLAARDLGEKRRADQMSGAVADPATRNTPAAQRATAEAQRRFDDLLARAQADYQRDAAHLVAELEALEAELPAALAPWTAVSWQGRPPASSGIRLGSVSMPEIGPLAVPLCLSAPLRRPLWIDTIDPGAVTPVVTSVMLRLVAGAVQPQATPHVIDVGGKI